MDKIEVQPDHANVNPAVAVLSLFGVVAALAAVLVAFALPTPWSAIVAVVGCVVAGGCVGAAVSMVRGRRGGAAS